VGGDGVPADVHFGGADHCQAVGLVGTKMVLPVGLGLIRGHVRAVRYFNNPLLLVQMRPQIEALFSRYLNGLDQMQTLMVNVRESLVHGLHLIFVSSACVMGGAVVPNLLVKNVPLRTHHHAPSSEPAV
jgi:hypothetical protein